MILYIHGFKSSSKARKGQILKQNFDNVLVPTLPISPLQAIELLESTINKNKIDFIVGSSLGGFYALYCWKKFSLRTLLINPSLTPWETLSAHIGTHTRFNSNHTFDWTKNHISELETIDETMKNMSENQKLLQIFASTDDEILDHSNLPKIFPNANIKFFENSGHSFTRFEEALKNLEK